jgi:hypothetical protein
MPNDELPDIDPTLLEAVTGGVTSSAGSGSQDQVIQMLTALMSSIKDLAGGQQNSGSSQFMQMLPMLMMMRGRSGPPPPPPIQYAPPPGDWTRVA